MSEETSLPAKPQRPRSTEPVAMPAWVRWREFRYSVMPIVVFAGAAAGCLWFWSQMGSSGGVAGIAEGVRSTVASPTLARIQSILVTPYQMVNAGDPIAVVVPIDPRAELDLVQMEFDLARISLQPSIAEANVMDFERIRMDLLRTKSELAIAKVNLVRMENQVVRNEPLYREQLLSEDLYDLAAKTRDAYQAEVFEKSNTVVHIEKRLVELEAFGLPEASTNSLMATTVARLQGLRGQVSSNWMPITLRAPIAGMVGFITHHASETALEGEPLVSINSLFSERIVGYLRQPYPIDPQIGMEVVMTTRERKTRRFTGAVLQIGAQVEMITNALAFVRTGALVDSGLPVAITLPPNVNIRPGEILDLVFRQPRADMGPLERLLPADGKPMGPAQHAAVK